LPGLIRAGAKCPECGAPLEALVDETSGAGVKRKLYHGKVGKRRRRLPCTQNFTSLAVAARFRKRLEVVTDGY
jgi:hypothetical protein